jgi:hypothetical protein
VIDILVDAGFSVKKCCEVLGVSSAGYYLAKTRSDVADDDPSRVAHRAHQRGPRRQSWHLRFSRPRARRADQRPRGSRQPRAGDNLDAQCRNCWRPGSSQSQAHQGHPDLRGSGAAQFRALVPGRVVGQRHHGAPDARGQGLLLLRARHLQPTHCGLVH